MMAADTGGRVMDRVRGEGEWFDRLAGATAPVELLDAAGRVVGTFLPAGRPARPAAGGPELTAAELDEIERTNARWFTTDEVVAHLRSLG
jgi:hypothetical protein